MNPRAVDSTTVSAGADARQKTQDATAVFIHGFLDAYAHRSVDVLAVILKS
jgi:hypothetical protein